MVAHDICNMAMQFFKEKLTICVTPILLNSQYMFTIICSQQRSQLNTSTKLGRKWWVARAKGSASCSRVRLKTSDFVGRLVFPPKLQKLPGSWWRSMVCALLVVISFIFCGHLLSCEHTPQTTTLSHMCWGGMIPRPSVRIYGQSSGQFTP